MSAVLLVAASLVAEPVAAPSRPGRGTGSVVLGGDQPSLVEPLLVLAGFVVVVGAVLWWWRHLGGWSPTEMTLALQAAGGDVDAVGQRVQVLSPDSPAALAHRRAAMLLPSVLRRAELSDVQAALAAARSALTQPGETHAPERTSVERV